jgi:hypothetical protein
MQADLSHMSKAKRKQARKAAQEFDERMQLETTQTLMDVVSTAKIFPRHHACHLLRRFFRKHKLGRTFLRALLKSIHVEEAAVIDARGVIYPFKLNSRDLARAYVNAPEVYNTLRTIEGTKSCDQSCC